MAGAISFPLLRHPQRFRILGGILLLFALYALGSFWDTGDGSAESAPFELSQEDEDSVASLKAKLLEAQREVADLKYELEHSNQKLEESRKQEGAPPEHAQNHAVQQEIVKKVEPLPPRNPAPRKNVIQALAQRQAGQCPALRAPTKADIRVDDIFDALPFDDPDGGVWKQGFPITYNDHQWDDEILNVFIVPHSHNDPGWIKTFTQYFIDQTKHIISNVINALNADASRSFIWAEISYFSVWWDEQSTSTRDTVRRLIKNGQLEIVTGGWVMPDEANSHYYAILDQLIEGHQWLEKNIGVKPVSGWSIDPFGYSPTMAYILKRAGLKGMVIQRVHYELKRILAEKKHLEFGWRQEWDREQKTDMMCHVMPFFSYDIPHTCGPDPSVCCQFDFARMGGRYSCPWPAQPTSIDSSNVAMKANQILDQYRKKAQLYQTKNVMIPLGDDFRYDRGDEVNAQFANYKMLMDYINGRPELKAKVKFGTLKEYFDSVFASASKHALSFPSFSGDFFPYSDRHKQYWTGYYTSRPFYKHMDRVLEATLRSAEIIYSMALNSRTASYLTPRYNALTEARRALGLFQHHDGITGTAKDHVVLDYARQMQQAISGLQTIISDSSQVLLADELPADQFLFSENKWSASDALPESKVIEVSSISRNIVVHNAHGRERREFVRLLVNDPKVQVYEEASKSFVPVQVNVAFPEGGLVSAPLKNTYVLFFEATIPAMGLAVYRLSQGTQSVSSFSTIELRNTVAEFSVQGFDIKLSTSSSPIVLSNPFFEATFDGERGLLSSVKSLDSGKSTKLDLEFVTYGSNTHEPNSGAYLFIPPAPATPYSTNSRSLVRIIKGDLVHEVHVVLEHVTQVVRLYKTNEVTGAMLEMTNFVDVRQFSNKELAMRFKTDIKASEFYSDLNGFQMKRRRNFNKLPIGGNYYPLPSMLLMEDATRRVSLHTASPMGCGSMRTGEFEVMMDRILMQDDNRGLQQGVQDNRLTRLRFALTVEDIGTATPSTSSGPEQASIFAHHTNDALNYPSVVMYSGVNAPPLKPLFAPLKDNLPCDIHMVNLRTLSPTDRTVALVLHRRGYSCKLAIPPVNCDSTGGFLSISKAFDHFKFSKIQPTTLSLMYAIDHTPTSNSEYEFLPNELYTFKLSLQ